MVRAVRRSYFGVFTMLAAMALLCVLAGGSAAAAGDTTRVSVDSSGNQADGGGSGSPSISADGRYVVFISSATKLVEGDTNGAQDVFVRDRDDDEDGVFDEPGETSTERASVDSSETEGNDNSSNGDWPSISANGRFVAFSSHATNLVPPGADTPHGDVFVRDLTAGTTERVNLADGRNEFWHTNNSAILPSISGDGRYVAFISAASNLVAGDTNVGPNRGYDVFVRDRQTSRTVRVSVDSSGNQASLVFRHERSGPYDGSSTISG